MKKIILGFFIAFHCVSGQAYHGSSLSAQSGSTSDKLDYQQIQVELTENKTNSLWPFKREKENSFGWGVRYRFDQSKTTNIKFQYSELAANLNLKLSKKHKILFESGVGLVEQDSQSTQPVGKISYQGHWLLNLAVKIQADRSMTAPLILPLDGLASQIFATGILTQINYTLAENWDFQMQTTNHFLLDKNQRNAFDVQMMYALSRFPHWIRVGFGSSYLNYQKRNINYWTPRRVSSYGPRIDFSFQIAEKLEAFAGGSYTFFQEDSFTPGDGHYLRTGIQYGDREKWKISASFENIEATQNSNLWFSHFYFVEASVFW